MSLLKILLWGLVIYYLYKFVFGVVVPVSKAAKQMKNTVQKMQEAQQKHQQQPTEPIIPKNKPSSTPKSDTDYIDFEEIK